MSLAADFAHACATGLVPGAEQILYTPLGGEGKTIWAMVDRFPPRPLGDFGVAGVYSLAVIIANDVNLGVASIDTGGDTVTLPAKLGDTPRTFKVRFPRSQDAGCFELLCG